MSVNTSSKKLGQRGDTIVEVMLVLAILGLAIGISYRTATRSLLATREAEEHSRATQLLQAQIERLYSLSATDPTLPTSIFKQNVPFCVDSTNNVIQPPTQIACEPGTIYTVSIIYCNLDYNAALCGGPTHTTDDTFALTAIWENVRGHGQDQVTMGYRIHKL